MFYIDMSEMLKTLMEQNKVMFEIMKTQSDKNVTSGPSNLAKRPADMQ